MNVVGQDVEIDVDGSAMAAYTARPADARLRPAVLVCSELWGLTDDVRALVRDVAALGYVAVAPDLYHRLDGDTARGFAETDANRTRAFELVAQLTREGVERDLRASLDYAHARADAAGKPGILGMSLGGHLAFYAAGRLDLAAAAIYYPGWLPVTGTALSRPEPLLTAAPAIAERAVRLELFFAELDHVIDAEQRDAIAAGLTAAGVRHEITVYEGAAHAFFFPGREPYHKAAADDSWERVAELFTAELG